MHWEISVLCSAWPFLLPQLRDVAVRESRDATGVLSLSHTVLRLYVASTVVLFHL